MRYEVYDVSVQERPTATTDVTVPVQIVDTMSLCMRLNGVRVSRIR